MVWYQSCCIAWYQSCCIVWYQSCCIAWHKSCCIAWYQICSIAWYQICCIAWYQSCCIAWYQSCCITRCDLDVGLRRHVIFYLVLIMVHQLVGTLLCNKRGYDGKQRNRVKKTRLERLDQSQIVLSCSYVLFMIRLINW